MSMWFVSDTHFNHENILKFKRDDDTPVRPGFEDVSHMNETMIDNWNRLVKPTDKVYHLGDVAFGRDASFEAIMRRLNGHKRLIMGNHDKFPIQVYARHFEKIGSWRQFKDQRIPFICCHYPLHPSALSGRKTAYCVHGHVHYRDVTMNDTKVPDERYINICVEKTNYSPIHLDELLMRMK